MKQADLEQVVDRLRQEIVERERAVLEARSDAKVSEHEIGGQMAGIQQALVAERAERDRQRTDLESSHLRQLAEARQQLEELQRRMSSLVTDNEQLKGRLAVYEIDNGPSKADRALQ